MDKTEKQLKKLINFADDSGLAIFDELQAIEEGLSDFNSVFGQVDLSNLTSIQGEKGEKGEPGKDGKDGKDGPQGIPGPVGREGYDGFDGKDGKDGLPGRDGKDGSPDTPFEIKSKLESLEGEARLDASAIKNLPKMVNKLAKDGYPYGLPQPAGAMTYRLNGAQVGRGNILNIQGTGITAVPLDDGITYIFSGTGGGAVNSVTASLPLTSSGGANPNIAINQPGVSQIWYTDTNTGILTGNVDHTINSNNGAVLLRSITGGSSSALNIDPNDTTLRHTDIATDLRLTLDTVSARLGDTTGAFGGNIFTVDDLNARVFITGVFGDAFSANMAGNYTVSMGALGIGNGTFTEVNDSLSFIREVAQSEYFVQDTAGNKWLSVATFNPSHLIQAGDITNSFNGTILSVDDVNQAIKFDYNGDFYTFPIGDGTVNQVLTTDGAGQLSWQNIGAGGAFLIGQTSGIVSAPGAGATFEAWYGQLAGGGGASIVATTFIGYGAGNNATGADLASMVGEGAGSGATFATGATFFGAAAGLNAVNAFNTTAMGLQAGQNATNASESIFFGGNAGNGATDANQATFIGASAGAGAASARHAIFIGFQTGMNDTVNNIASGTSIIIGDNGSTGGFSDSIGIGADVVNTANNQLLVDSPSSPFVDMVFNVVSGTVRLGNVLIGGNQLVVDTSLGLVDIEAGVQYRRAEVNNTDLAISTLNFNTIVMANLTANRTVTLITNGVGSNLAPNGFVQIIKNKWDNTFNVIVDTPGGQLIDGALSITLLPGEAVTLMSDGVSNWDII